MQHLFESWKFIPEFSEDEFTRIPADGCSFHLDHENYINPDDLLSGPGKERTGDMVGQNRSASP